MDKTKKTAKDKNKKNIWGKNKKDKTEKKKHKEKKGKPRILSMLHIGGLVQSFFLQFEKKHFNGSEEKTLGPHKFFFPHSIQTSTKNIFSPQFSILFFPKILPNKHTLRLQS